MLDLTMRPQRLTSLNPQPHIHHLAIGVFDGVHLGHQAVLRQTAALGEPSASTAITFDPHPLQVITPHKAPPLLTTLAQRCSLMLACNLGQLVVLHFEAALRELTAEQFIQELRRIFPHLQTISIGENWAFGKNREGNPQTLQTLGARLGFVGQVVPPVQWKGEPVSSTRIREAIMQRDFGLAAELLGRPYALEGRVIHGDERGRTLGFPTANFGDLVQLLPPPGVYAGTTQIRHTTYRTVLNIGNRPTFSPDTKTSLEAYILDFSDNLYDQVLDVTPLHFLRGEQKFADADSLRRQIERDVEVARTILM